ncbi:hypothetical protein CVU75_00585 [Candidatus Dependentiae bacterium HGW-Dependentiae-1]|nr:MAG: hypothetical protein CVU75_00585 [Candidatus Dependentiae bacterium HGW-Dependentiae-1]
MNKTIFFSMICILTFLPTLYSMDCNQKSSKKHPLEACVHQPNTPVERTKKNAPEEQPLRFTRIERPEKDSDSAQFIIMRRGSEKIGRISFTYDADSKQGYIEDLDVEKKYRRQKFGKLLMQEALHDFEKLGCQEIGLCARPDEKKYMQKLIAFYEQFGFRMDANDSNTDDDAVIMEMKTTTAPAI